MIRDVEANLCRSCGSPRLARVLDLGRCAIADRLIHANLLDRPEPSFRLVVGFCPDCTLMQLVDVAAPDFLYDDDYPYFTTELPGLLAHFRASARAILARLPLGPGSLVVEAASNDGYMLREFAAWGVPVLGVDPAPGPARKAEASGVPTVVDFFCLRVARALAAEGRRADLILGNNILNLVPDPNDFAMAIDALLDADGEVVLEIPYCVEMVRHCWYDNVFHQNTTYFTLVAVDRLFRRHGLHLRDVERIPVFGGSLRVSLRRTDEPTDAVRALLAEERALGVDRSDWCRDFAERAEAHRTALSHLVCGLRAAGKRIAAYGAAGGMATTLLGYVDLSGALEYAVDVNPHKHGWYTPGSRLLISPPGRLLEDQPDYVLLLAWNYADEILAAQAEYRRRGGRFIIPFPEPAIV